MLDNFINGKQKKIIVIVGIIVGILVMVIIYQKAGNNRLIELEEDSVLIQNADNGTQEKENGNRSEEERETIVVHIAGEVSSPGIVKLKEGDRIEDAIERAGGLTENAEISNVNLAYILEDGVKIIIPGKNTDIGENIVIQDAGNGIIIEETNKNESKDLININKATQVELEKLPGIGASIAGKIIEYRNENGNFSNIEEVKNVSGIGESKYRDIKDFISIK